MKILSLADCDIYGILKGMVDNKLENKIKNTILDKNLIEKNEHIIIGLSGGPDSVCLFNSLLNLSDELQFTISAVHVNHKFRPGAAEEDQAYVEELCRQRGVECDSYVYDCNAIAEEKNMSSEEAGRFVRYKSFYETAKKLIDNRRCDSYNSSDSYDSCGSYNSHDSCDSHDSFGDAQWEQAEMSEHEKRTEQTEQPEQKQSHIKIAVAQNLNDQAETLLMRIIRGTGTDGLAGIEYSRKGAYGTTIIRPLLDVSRREVEEYCLENNLNPRIDSTNSQAIYTRNKVRLNLIPKLEQEFNSNIVESLNRLSKIAKEDKDYFDKQVEDVMGEAALVLGESRGDLEGGESTATGISFSAKYLQSCHLAIRHRVIRKAFETLGLDQGITAAHITAADSIIVGRGTSAITDFPRGYSMAVSYGEVRFFKNDPESLGYVSDAELKTKLRIRIVKYNGNLKDISQNGTKRYAALDLNKLLEKLWSSDAPYFDKIEEMSSQRENADESENSYFEDELAKEIQAMIQIRTRRQGDWIVPLGMSGRKKLQDLFVDEKVYRECRDQVPMVCIGDEVLWIIGDDVSGYNTGMKKGRISENYKLEKDTKEIVVLEFSYQL